MHQVYPDEGLIYTLRQIVGLGDTHLGWQLFTNDIMPNRSTVLADVELADDSWAKVERTSADFTLAQVFTHIATIQAPNIVYTNDSGDPVDVYGYVILSDAGDKLVGIARFDDAPRTIADGGPCIVVPLIGDFSDQSS